MSEFKIFATGFTGLNAAVIILFLLGERLHAGAGKWLVLLVISAGFMIYRKRNGFFDNLPIAIERTGYALILIVAAVFFYKVLN